MTIERAAVWISALVCVVFLATLQHRPLPSVAPPPPSPVVVKDSVERDAHVDVSIKAVARAPRALADGSLDGSLGEPLAGATVRAFWEVEGSYHDVGSCRSDSSGRCRLERLPRGTLWILGEANGRARAGTLLTLDANERVATLYLVPTQRLEVTVRDENGHGMKDATVLVTTDEPLPYGALTDAEGGVVLDRVGAPPYTVKASARGYESATAFAEGGTAALTLRRLATLLVEVNTADGEPAARAAVAIGGPSLWPPRTIRTDPLGRALIHGLLPGTFDVRATLGERLSRTETQVVVGRGEERRLVMTLRPARRLEIMVTDGDAPDAAAVSVADVVVAEDGVSSFPLRGRTDAMGRVVLGPVESGPAVVSASAPGFVGSMSVPVPEPLDEPLKVPLLRGGTISGRVVDAYDHAVAGASLEVVGTDSLGMPVVDSPLARASRTAHFAWAVGFPGDLLPVGELGVMIGPILPITQAMPLEYFVAPSISPNAPIVPDLAASGGGGAWVSGVDGRFTATPVTPGRLAVLARHPEYVEGRSELVSVGPGGRVEVTIVLSGGGILEGRVVDHWDRPVGGARVEVTAQSSTLRRVTTSASDGSFTFAALPGQVWIAVACPEHPEQAAVRQRVTIRPDQRENLRIALPEPREPMGVTVVDEGHRPIDAAEIAVSSLSVGKPFGRTRYTNQLGEVTFDDARGLTLSIRAEAAGFLVRTITTESAPEHLQIVLERGVEIVGRVTSVRGRRSVSGARITVKGSERRQSVLSDSEGHFRIGEVAPGRVSLVVEAAGLATQHTERRVERTGRADRPFDVGDIDLVEGTMVSGVVVDSRGEPVPAARVSETRAESYVPLGITPPGTVTTDRAGRFSFPGVGEGTVVLEAVASGVGRGRSEKVTIVAGHEVSELRIVLGTEDRDTPAYSGPANLAISLGERDSGLVVLSVAPGSMAERGGLRSDDRLVSIDGVKPKSVGEARQLLGGAQSSDVVLEVLRGEQALRLRIVREAVR